MVLLGADGAHHDNVRGLAEPERPEAEVPEVGEQEPERRIQGDGQERSDDHREGLRIAKGLEQTPLLGLQGQHGKKRDGDDQKREKTRPPDLLDGPDDHLPVIAFSALLLPHFELLVRLFHHHDG